MTDAKQKQLEMVWPESRLSVPPVAQPPPGYRLRTYQPSDEVGFFRVLALAGFTGWDRARLAPILPTILPDGWFVIVHEATGEVVATAMAQHHPTVLHPAGGEMGWVAGHPAHAGKGLGMAVCAAATARLLSAGYRDVYLKTDDFRLPAIKTYLKLGYVPFLYTDGMAARWQRVCEQLAWPYPIAEARAV